MENQSWATGTPTMTGQAVDDILVRPICMLSCVPERQQQLADYGSRRPARMINLAAIISYIAAMLTCGSSCSLTRIR